MPDDRAERPREARRSATPARDVAGPAAAGSRWRAAAAPLHCFRCGSGDVRYDHCKVFCRACGALVENCAGD